MLGALLRSYVSAKTCAPANSFDINEGHESLPGMWSNPVSTLSISAQFEITGLNDFPQKSASAPLAVLCPGLAGTTLFVTA